MSDEERAQRVEDARERWNSMSESKKAEICAAAVRGIQLASKEGSKLEKFLFNELQQNGL